MDTKERSSPNRRRRPAQGRPTQNRTARSAAPREKAPNARPRRESSVQTKPNPSRRRTTSAKAPVPERRRQRPVGTAKRPAAERRVVRAPREDIPEAVYTMPKPFRKGKFLLRLVSVVAVVIALMMAISIFFRVDTVEVLGAEKYTAWMVSEASGIQKGDGLLTLSKARAAGKIRSALPYVDEVKITIKLPGTVHIEVTELKVTYAISALDNTWWLIDAKGEAVEQITSSAASSYTRIFGFQVEAPRAGQVVVAASDQLTAESTDTTGATDESAETSETAASEESGETQAGQADVALPTQAADTNAGRLQAALSILQSLERNGIIGDVASVNVQSLTDIQLQYGQRFQVRLGNIDNLDYKISYMAQAINQMEDYQSGVLDVSFEYNDQGIFTPEA